MTTDIRELIDKSPMSGFQIAAIAVCVVLNMLDGFDVLVVAFTASEISRAWGLSATELGGLLSAGLIGMSLGSLVVAPLADVWGRRAIVLLSLALVTVGMLSSALARGVYELAALRVVTGLGIGGMLASLTVITSEYASERRRNMCVSLYSTGYPIGAVLGGSLAAFLIARYGWRSVYAFGGALSLSMIPVVIARMPESLDFLLAKRKPDSLARVNRLLQQLGHAVVPALPAPALASEQSAGLAQLVRPPLRARTFRIWTAFFVHMFCFYFVVSWTPKLLVGAGLSPAQGISGGVVLSLGGILGGIGFAFLSSRWALNLVTGSFMLFTALAMVLFGVFASALDTSLPLACVVGFFIYGAMMGIYALTPQLYPALLRATGMGFAIGMGRIGGIVSPTIAGVLLDAGWRPEQVFFAFAAPMLVAVIAALSLRRADDASSNRLVNPGLEARSSV